MRSIKVEKEKLLAVLKANRAEHRDTFLIKKDPPTTVAQCADIALAEYGYWRGHGSELVNIWNGGSCKHIRRHKQRPLRPLAHQEEVFQIIITLRQ